nr:VWA domain-containing protein [bacterium]
MRVGIEFSNPWWLLALVPIAAFFVFVLVKRRSHRLILPALGRFLLCAIMIAAAAGMSFLRGSHLQQVMLVGDVSQSAQGARAQIEKQIRAAIGNMPAQVRAGVASFAGTLSMESSVSQKPVFETFESTLNTRQTDIASALRSACALLPSEGARRIVLVSDGMETKGDAIAQAKALAGQGVRVDVQLVSAAAGPDAQVTSVAVPWLLYSGQRFDVVVVLDANQAMKGTLQLYGERELVAEAQLSLAKGENRYVFSLEAGAAGLSVFEAVWESGEDSQSANDRLQAVAKVAGKARVLLAEGKPGNAGPLQAILQAAGMQADVISAWMIPADFVALCKYDAVVLVDVTADMLSGGRMELLERYVRQAGKGLMTVGGDQSYALGGWRNTPLEQALPVNCQARGKEADPTATVLLIDCSGSMASGMEGGAGKMEMARQAAIRA